MNEKNELDKRKAFILATVVYEYIATAEPVGSNTLTQKYNLGVSSATIRNEMAELEAGGYLIQPHTSAGRIPSDAGYRTYVDRLMQREALAPDDVRRIRDQFREASREMDDVIDQTTRLLSSLSNNLAFAIAPSRDSHAFKHVQLIWLSARTALAIVVTSMGVASQIPIDWHADVTPDALTRFSNALNARLSGRIMEDIVPADITAVAAEVGVTSTVRTSPRRARRICSTSPSSTICANCAPSYASSRNRRRSTNYLPTNSARVLPPPNPASGSVTSWARTRWPNAASSPCRIASAIAVSACSRSSGRAGCPTAG